VGQAQAQVQAFYRCGNSFQDHPCGTSAGAAGYGPTGPLPDGSAPSASDHYRAYLDQAERDRAADTAQAAAVRAAAAPSGPAPMSEADRRAVFNCNADQQVEQMRHNGYPTFTCDQRTGEKKAGPQVVVVDPTTQTQRIVEH